MNKNHIDVLLAGSSEMVTKYNSKLKKCTTVNDYMWYDKLTNHWLKLYQRAIARSRLTKDT